MGSAARILDFRNVLSWASSGVIRNACISLRTQSIHLPLDLPLGLFPGTLISTITLISLFSSILCLCPYQRSLIALTFSCMYLCTCNYYFTFADYYMYMILCNNKAITIIMLFTPSSFLMSTLFSLSLNATPFILLNIVISVFSRICSSFFRTVQHSAPYRSTGLMTVIYSLIFNFLGMFLSLITPDMSLNLPHAALTLALTASSDPPSSLMVTSKYLNLFTCLRLVPWLSLMFAFVPLLLLTITSVFPMLILVPCSTS